MLHVYRKPARWKEDILTADCKHLLNVACFQLLIFAKQTQLSVASDELYIEEEIQQKSDIYVIT